MSDPLQHDRALARILVDRGLVTEPEVRECLAHLEALAAEGVAPLPRLHDLLLERGLLKDAPSTPHAAQRLGPYVLQGELGRGGMAVVYRALHLELGRPVALKVVKDAAHADPRLLERFHREAEAVAKLRHPNIVTVHDAGKIDGVPFLAMELVEGETLGRRGSLRDRVTLVKKVAEALGHAHQHGVVHRDLKPGNILVDKAGEPRVVDFGLAHLSQASTSLTRSGAILGTPLYMSPEQVRGSAHEAGPASDVYSLGVILYELLTGRVPFESERVEALYRKILEEEPRRMDRAIPADLETITLKAMEKEAARRYATADELAEDLRRWLEGEPIGANPPSAWYKLRKRWAKRRALVGVGLAGLLAVGLVAAILVPLVVIARRRAERARAASIAQLRNVTGAALSAALGFRQQGKLADMEKYLAETERACQEAIKELPDLAEPHYRLGRMLRAQMKDEEALAEQERALAKEPNYAPSRYERVVLAARKYRRRVEELEDAAQQTEGRRRAGEGEIRPGTARELPSRKKLTARDAEARRWMRVLDEDLAALERNAEGLSEGEVLCARGLRAWLMEDVGEARRLLARAIEKASPLEEGYEALATLEQEARRFDESVRWWTAGRERDAGYVPHLEGRGLARVSWGAYKAGRGENPGEHYQAAIEDYGEALKLNPARDESWMGRGDARTNWGVYRENRGEDPRELYRAAIEDYGEALKVNPARDVTWMSRGGARVNWGHYKEGRGEDPGEHYLAAIEDYGEALKLDPTRAETWMSRGVARVNWGNYKAGQGDDPGEHYRAAIEDYGEALRLDPARDETRRSRGNARVNWGLYKQGRGDDPGEHYRAAIEDLGEALKLNPARDETWMSRGQARVNWGAYKAGRGEDPGGDYRAAIEDFGEALKLNAARDETWMRRGVARASWGHYKAGRGEDPGEHYRAAIEDLGEALKRNPARDETWQSRGGTRVNWGAYKQGRGEDPRGHYEAALKDFARALEINRSNATVWHHRGNAHYNGAIYKASRKEKAGADYRAALESYAEAARLNPTLEPQLRPYIDACRRALDAHPDE